jgi:hypothetical protein
MGCALEGRVIGDTVPARLTHKNLTINLIDLGLFFAIDVQLSPDHLVLD